MITVSLDGLGEALQRLGAVPRDADAAFARTADEVFDFVESRVDTHTKTNTLRDSLFHRREGNDYLIGHDLSRAPHAVFVHWGTRPHEIRPRLRKALRWPAGGAFAFAQRVQHPGYEGDPYLRQAARKAPAIFERHVRQLLGDS